MFYIFVAYFRFVLFFFSAGRRTWQFLPILLWAMCYVADTSKLGVNFVYLHGMPENLPYYCKFCWCHRDNDSNLVSDCSHIGLFRPPKELDNTTIELYFQENELHRVKRYHFAGLVELKLLDLSTNCISSIENGSFSDLVNLEVLYLHGQRVKGPFVLTDVFSSGVFTGLTALKHLTLHKNIDMNSASDRFTEMPTDALMELVNLEELSIDGIRWVKFDEKFEALKNLSTIYMSGTSGVCEIDILSKLTFKGVPKLRNLTVENCGIKHIGTGTFWWTTDLEYLDISSNYIEIDRFGIIASELQYTKLKVLKINSIHNPNVEGTKILRGDMRYIQYLQLTELHMNENGIEFIDLGVFDKFPKTIKRLYMRRNKLRFGHIVDEAVFNNDNLEVFDAGDQLNVNRLNRVQIAKLKRLLLHGFKDRGIGSRILDDDTLTQDTRVSRTKRSGLPQVNLRLKVLVCSGSHSDMLLKSHLNFTDTINVIETMDLSRNFIPLIPRGSFDGLSKLKLLNLSYNYIEHFTLDVFKGLDSLEVLDLSGNLFGDMIHLDNGGEIFSHVKELVHLNISSNRIYNLGVHMFRAMYKLQTLDLSDNYIESVDSSFENLKYLRFLSLKNNRLQTLPEIVRNSLSKLLAQHGVTLDFADNKLACNCDNIPFLEWLFQPGITFVDKQSYYCTFNNNTRHSLNGSAHEFLEWLKEDCKSYMDVIIGCSTGGSFVASVVIVVSIYLNRWKLRYLYYMAKVKLDHPEKPDPAAGQFMFDVFLSYGDGDRQFIANDIVEHLENRRQLRLNIRDRDFDIGEVIAVNISKAIKQSKKTFLLISRHFLANKWCNFEMNMARMEELYKKRKVLVIIFLEKIPARAMPIELVDLLRESPSMELPKDEHLRFAFWEKCKEFIKD